jgi:hypothetical protein
VPHRPGRRHRVATALFLTAATACFLVALVTAAAIHFLFVQGLLDWVAFAQLLALALCFGLVGWQVLSLLRSSLRRTLGVLPDTGADAARRVQFRRHVAAISAVSTLAVQLLAFRTTASQLDAPPLQYTEPARIDAASRPGRQRWLGTARDPIQARAHLFRVRDELETCPRDGADGEVPLFLQASSRLDRLRLRQECALAEHDGAAQIQRTANAPQTRPTLPCLRQRGATRRPLYRSNCGGMRMYQGTISVGVLCTVLLMAGSASGEPAGLTAADLVGEERVVDLEAAQRDHDAAIAQRQQSLRRQIDAIERGAVDAPDSAATSRRFDPRVEILSAPRD